MQAFIDTWDATSSRMRAIALIVLSTVAFAAMHTLVRYVSASVHPFEIAFFRNLFGMLVFLPWLARSGLAILRTGRPAMHALRAALNLVAMLAFFTGLSMAPLARVTALAFTAPVFAVLLGVLVLRERLYFHRSASMFCAFAGTLVILRPGFQTIDTGSLLVLFSSAIWGITLIVIKTLARTDSSMTITAYMNLLLGLLSFVPALLVWSTPGLESLAGLLAIGILGTLGQLGMAQALKEAETGVVMPFDFLRLVWISILGYLLFGEVPDLFVWIGAGIVFSSTLYLAYRESRMRSRPGLRPDG